MKLADFIRALEDIATNREDQVKVTETLTKLKDDFTNFSTNVEGMSKQLEDFTTENKALKEQNMNLFLRVGNPVESPKVNTTESLTFDDLLTKEFGVNN